MAAEKRPESVSRFKVKGQPYEIDGAKLTLGEQDEIERHFDCDFIHLYMAQGMLAMIYVAMHREDAKVSWDDVEALTSEDIEEEPVKRPTGRGRANAGTPAS